MSEEMSIGGLRKSSSGNNLPSGGSMSTNPISPRAYSITQTVGVSPRSAGSLGGSSVHGRKRGKVKDKKSAKEIFDDKETDKLRPELLQSYSSSMVKNFKKARQKERYNPFDLHTETKPAKDPKKKEVSMFERKFNLQILIQVKELTFDIGVVEPFFCTLALFDITNQSKLSENFFFIPNNDLHKKYLLQLGESYAVTQLFSLSLTLLPIFSSF